MVGCPKESAGGSSIRLGGCVIRSNSAWLPRQPGEECLVGGVRVLVAASREACAKSLSQDTPRVRHRLQYTKVQWEYNEDKSCCAQDVISGIWQDPPTHLPLEVHLQSLFEKALVLDNRCLQPVGPPKWELMAPITAEDVNRYLKGMKD